MDQKLHNKEADVDEHIPLERARNAICFPGPGTAHCNRLIRTLSSNNIKFFINKGPIYIAGLRLLGKGWASNVFLATLGEKIVAVKALRPGSRRASLLHEAAMLLTASKLMISPKVYKYTDLFIAMQYIDSIPLIDAIQLLKDQELYYILRRLLTKAYLLDLIGISHNELARPHNQVLVEKNTLEPYIIDYESATISETPTNLTQLVGGILRIKRLRNIISSDETRLRNILRQYKREKDPAKKANIVNSVIREIAPYNA